VVTAFQISAWDQEHVLAFLQIKEFLGIKPSLELVGFFLL
jgi:hypothetical protein